MSYASLEDKVGKLDGRLRRVEERIEGGRGRALSFESLNRLGRDEWSRILGWFVITISALAMLMAWYDGQPLNPWTGLGVVIGLWLLMRSVHLVGISDSARQLMLEERGRKANHAGHIHRRSAVRASRASETEKLLAFFQLVAFATGVVVFSVSYAWLIYTYVAEPAWQVVGWLVIPMLALMYGFVRKSEWIIYSSIALAYVFLMGNRAPLFSLLALPVLTVFLLAYAWERSRWLVHGFLMILSYGVLAYWTWAASNYGFWQAFLPAGGWTTVDTLILGLLVVFSFLFAWPFAVQRRQAMDRQLAAGMLCLNAAGFISIASWLNSQVPELTWAVAQAALAVLFAGLGYLAWLRHQRFSHAKYFFFIAAACAFILALAFLDALSIGVLLMVIAVILLSLGFIAESYSARTAGLGVLAASVLYYFAVILTQYGISGNLIISYEPAWIGIVLAVFLLVTSGWFRDFRASGVEKRLQPMILAYTQVAAFFVLFSVVFYGLTTPYQAIAWLALGIGAIASGRTQHLGILRALGLGLIAIAIIKLFLIDSLSLDVSARWGVFTAFGVLLTAGAYLSARYSRFILSLFA